MKAVRLKSSGQSVGRRMIYGRKDLWKHGVSKIDIVFTRTANVELDW